MQPHQNVEENLGDALGDALTNGWYTAGKGLSLVVLKLFSSNILALTHHRFGTRFLTWGTLWWNIAIMGIGWVAANGIGRTIFGFQMLAVIAAFIYHIFESKSNLWNAGKGQRRRHSLYLGDSMLWPLYQRLLMALNLENSFWGRISGYGFVKWFESGLWLILGFLLMPLGLVSNGIFLMMNGASLFGLIQHGERMDMRRKQQLWDAENESEEITHVQESPQPQDSNRVARRVPAQTFR